MNKWNKYYTEKYHPVKANTNFTNIAKPTIDMDEISELSLQYPLNNKDDLEAYISFETINNGNATTEELEAAKQKIKNLSESPYRSALIEGVEKWDKYYSQKTQAIKDKPKLDMDNLRQLKNQFLDEYAEVHNQLKIVESGNATEADIRKMEDLISQVKSTSPGYYAELEDTMKSWEPYYTQKFQKDNSQSTYYQQIIDLSKEGKIPDYVALNSILESAKNDNQARKEELDTISQLVEISQKYSDIQKRSLPDYRQQMYEDLEKNDQKLKELMKNVQGSKEEVEENLRKLVEPMTYNLTQNIKKLEEKLAQINDPNQRDNIIAEVNRGIGKNIPAETYEELWKRQLDKNLQSKEQLEKNIKNVVELYEKIKNKDYPDSEKGNPKKEEPHKPHNPFKLDDEEVKGLTEPNSKLRNLANSIKEKAKKVLNWIKEHPVKAAALLATTGLVGITAVVGISSALNNAKGETNEEQTEISQEAETLATQTPIEKTVEDAMQQTVAETPVLDNSDIANQVLADEQARIASGNDAVYQDIHSAANEQNQLYAQSSDVQAIWQNTNVEAGKMYQVEADGSLSEIHGVDALVQAGNEGKTIVSTWQNEDGTLGRSVITPSEFGQSMENVEESAKTR